MVCCLISFPQFGQCGVPTRAHEKAQIVVDLRHRAHRRARILRGRFLIDGDGGGEAVDVVHVGLFLLPEKHPRVGRQAFHIPPLSLGIDGVKRQRAFSAAGQSRDDGQLVARDAHINVLEVVLPRALDNDIFLHSLPFAPVYLCRDRFSVIAYTNHFLMSILV